MSEFFLKLDFLIFKEKQLLSFLKKLIEMEKSLSCSKYRRPVKRIGIHDKTLPPKANFKQNSKKRITKGDLKSTKSKYQKLVTYPKTVGDFRKRRNNFNILKQRVDRKEYERYYKSSYQMFVTQLKKFHQIQGLRAWELMHSQILQILKVC